MPSLPQPSREHAPPIDDALFTPRFWLACSVHFSGAMASSLYILFPLFIRHLGGSELTIGLYAGLTGAAAVAARIPVGRFLDSHGPRRVLIVAGCLNTVTWLAFLSIGTLGMRSAALVVAYGIASGSLFASYFTYASDITPVTRRSEGFAMFGIWGMLPNGLGPLLGEFLIAHASFHTYFVIAGAFACTSLCLCLLLPETVLADAKGSAHSATSSGSFPGRAFVLLLATTFMFGCGVNSLYTFLAPFAYSHGRDGVGSRNRGAKAPISPHAAKHTVNEMVPSAMCLRLATVQTQNSNVVPAPRAWMYYLLPGSLLRTVRMVAAGAVKSDIWSASPNTAS